MLFDATARLCVAHLLSFRSRSLSLAQRGWDARHFVSHDECISHFARPWRSAREPCPANAAVRRPGQRVTAVSNPLERYSRPPAIRPSEAPDRNPGAHWPKPAASAASRIAFQLQVHSRPTCTGDARAPSGSSIGYCCRAVRSRCERIFAIASGSSMLAMILSWPPQRATAELPESCERILESVDGTQGVEFVDDEPDTRVVFSALHGLEDREAHPRRDDPAQRGDLVGGVRQEEHAAGAAPRAATRFRCKRVEAEDFYWRTRSSTGSRPAA